LDGLSKRISRDMELCEEYEGREDGLIEMSVVFGNIEKKFGPADNTKVTDLERIPRSRVTAPAL
jgi:hypothetical protein